MRGEVVSVDSRLNEASDGIVNNTSDSSFQLSSLVKEVKDSGYIYVYGSLFEGELELGEKNISQNFVFNNMRVRKSADASFFFHKVMRQLSFRDELLAQDKGKKFHSSINHCVLPSCQYYIFALRRIII